MTPNAPHTENQSVEGPDFGAEEYLNESNNQGTDEADLRNPWSEVRRKYADADVETRVARQRAVEKLREQHHTVRVRETDELCRYDPDTGIYRDDGEAVAREDLEEGLDKYNRRHESNEVLYKLRQQATVDLDEFGPAGKVCVANGVLDVTDSPNPELQPHDPSHLFLRQHPVAFEPDAECPRFEAFVEDAVRAEDRCKLQEFVGYTVFHQWDLRFQRALLLLGPTEAGKSTFLKTITALFGEDNIASLSLQQLANDRFAPAELHGTLANVHNDLDDDLVSNLGQFKQLVAGDQMQAQKKYKDLFTFRPTAKQLYAANRVPEVEDAGDAFYRRWIHVEFPETVPREDRDQDLEDKLREELPGILNWALEGYWRLMETERFTDEDTIEEKRAVWKSYGDSIERFVERGPAKLVTDAETPKDEVYTNYQAWCAERDLPVEAKQTLTKKLKQEYGVETCRVGPPGDRTRCYRGLTLAAQADQEESDQ